MINVMAVLPDALWWSGRGTLTIRWCARGSLAHHSLGAFHYPAVSILADGCDSSDPLKHIPYAYWMYRS